MRKEAGIPMVEPVAVLPTIIQVAGDIGVEERLPFLDRQDLAGEVGKKWGDPLYRRVLLGVGLGGVNLITSQFHAQPRPCPNPGMAGHNKRKRKCPISSL